MRPSELVFGFHPLREALRHRPHAIVEVWVDEHRRGHRQQEILELCQRHRVSVHTVGRSILDTLTAEEGGDPGVHNGFLARVIEQPSSQAKGDTTFRVLVEDVQDPRNLGALLRVCEGAGVGQIAIRDRGSAPVSPTVVKASAGAIEWLDVERIPNSAQYIEQCKKERFWVFGTTSDGQPPWQADLSGPILLCFGGEEAGLRKRTRDLCDFLLGLPMLGQIESLNLATAAAAILYEAVRQRSAATKP